MHAFWIILTAFLVGSNCSLLGSFLMLRREAMLGDAISHAVLPGIVIAFLIANSLHPLVLLTGAALAGLGAVALISFLHRQTHLPADVAIGITFTAFFATGILLVSGYTHRVDLDQDCVLYGHLLQIPFSCWSVGGWLLPTTTCLLTLLLGVNILFLSLGYRSLCLMSFDPCFARTVAMPTTRWYQLLMVLVSLTTVLAFKAVGAVLVVAFLVVPSATAYLLTDRLLPMLYLGVFIDGIVAYGGYFFAQKTNGSLTGALVLVGALCFALAFLWSCYRPNTKPIPLGSWEG